LTRSRRQGYPLVGGIVLTSFKAGIGIMHTSRGGIALCDSKEHPVSVKISSRVVRFTWMDHLSRRFVFQGLPTTWPKPKKLIPAAPAAMMTPLRTLLLGPRHGNCVTRSEAA
jgi:hypothetical protein